MEAAFFDLDKTVLARSATLALGRPLRERGLVTRSQLAKSVFVRTVYGVIGFDGAKIERVRRGLLEMTKGWERAAVEEVVRETITEITSPLVYPEALALMREHRDAGRRVYIVSSSPEEVVRPVAEHLGAPHYVATRAAVDEAGCYTGRLDFYCVGSAKADVLREEADRHGIDLDRSYAYSDSITDLPMLEAVGRPSAVNPDRALRRIAAERGWPVLRFVRPRAAALRP